METCTLIDGSPLATTSKLGIGNSLSESSARNGFNETPETCGIVARAKPLYIQVIGEADVYGGWIDIRRPCKQDGAHAAIAQSKGVWGYLKVTNRKSVRRRPGSVTAAATKENGRPRCSAWSFKPPAV